MKRWVAVALTVALLAAPLLLLSQHGKALKRVSTDSGESVSVVGVDYSIPGERFGYEPYAWLDPSTGSVYSTASWSYSFTLSLENIALYNATIAIEYKFKLSAKWVRFDSATWTNVQVSSPVTTITLSDNGSEPINAHMDRLFTETGWSKSDGGTYTVDYRIILDFMGVGSKSNSTVPLYYNVTITQNQARYKSPASIGASYYSYSSGQWESKLTDGSDSTRYEHSNTFASVGEWSVQRWFKFAVSGFWGAVIVKIRLAGKYSTTGSGGSYSMLYYVYARKPGTSTQTQVTSGSMAIYSTSSYSFTWKSSNTVDLRSYIDFTNNEIDLGYKLTLRVATQPTRNSLPVSVTLYGAVSEISVVDTTASWLGGGGGFLALLLFVVLALYFGWVVRRRG